MNNTFSAFEVPTTEQITYIPGRPRAYRGDCKAGQFKLGENKFLGSELKMEILGYRTFEDQLFDYPRQNWGEIFFVDESNVVSHILIKTISLENYLDLMLELKTEGKILAAGVTTAKMVKKTSELGVYYAIEFSWSPMQPERFQELSQFISTLSAPVYAARLKDAEEGIPALDVPVEPSDPAKKEPSKVKK